MTLIRAKKKVHLVMPKKKRLKLKKSPLRISWGGEDKGKGKLIDYRMLYQPRVPFPSALKAKPTNKKTLAKNEELMKLFKQVLINIPLLDAIKLVPTYVKFLKELCTRRREP